MPPSGEDVSVASLLNSLARETTQQLDLSYALPVLLHWGPTPSWTNRYHQRLDHTSLLASFLKARHLSQFCGGCHWRWALAYAVFGKHGQSIDSSTMDEAKRLLAQEMVVALEGIDPAGHIPLPREHQGAAIATAISFQAHTLEWLLICVEDEELASRTRIHRAIGRLIDEARLHWDALPYRDLAHAAHALRLYATRIDEAMMTVSSTAIDM